MVLGRPRNAIACWGKILAQPSESIMPAELAWLKGQEYVPD
ncbi:hypothetical protein [Allocoleopsis franciscana]|nr:hypothetical protein [Allocoleopsis franciscana]